MGALKWRAWEVHLRKLQEAKRGVEKPSCSGQPLQELGSHALSIVLLRIQKWYEELVFVDWAELDLDAHTTLALTKEVPWGLCQILALILEGRKSPCTYSSKLAAS